MKPRMVIAVLSLLIVLLTGVLGVLLLRAQSSPSSGPAGQASQSWERDAAPAGEGEAAAWLELHNRMQRLAQRVEALEARSPTPTNAGDDVSRLANRVRAVESGLDEAQRARRRLESRLAGGGSGGDSDLEREIERLRRQVQGLERPDSVRHLEEMLSDMRRSIDTLRSDLYRLKLDVQSLDRR